MASLKVAVRVRPFNNREHEMDAKVIVQMDGKKTRLLKPKHTTIDNNNVSTSIRDNFNDFTFDYSYWSFENDNGHQHVVTQEEVYNDLGMDVINCAFQGYNACVFAYGQTGSGKTFTMMGSPEQQGLIPRICKEMFNRMKLGQQSGTGYKTNVSYLEIYNERVKDLLSNNSNNVGHGLRVREHRTLGPYVEDLSQHPVANYPEIQSCIDRGNTLRTTASTNMNDTSSRSHAIFTITFVQAVFMDEMPSETVSKIHLVDLAGSERANATGATGERLKEGAHINKSLVTLGSVISALAEQSTQPFNCPTGKKRAYIPYRDSVLTWLLKDSLGGNSKTIMIAAISPADCNYSETLSTLRYANRAKNIINKPTINEDPNVKLIRELREEIMKLKGLLTSGDITDEALHNRSSQMLEDLLKKEAQEKFLTEEWAEKWRQAQSILREEKTLGLRKSGVGIVLDSEAPHLIGIHDDISTGVTLYSLKEGETVIGNNDDNGNNDEEHPVDIVLRGTGILPLHCTIELVNGMAIIHPQAGAQCWLNANLITEPTAISQGDILLLGRTNMFRYNNPIEAAKLRKGDYRSRSRADLSRLSLIAASRENLSGSLHCFNDDDLHFGLMTASMKKDKNLGSPEQYEDIQEEHRKILETIENALHKLNTERTHIFDQHKIKVQQLNEKLLKLEENNAEKLAILNCQEELLSAKRDMIAWNKSNKKTQIDIGVKQISTLQTHLDSKRSDFQQLMVKELHELQEKGKLDELHIEKYESSTSTDGNYEILLTASDLLLGSDNDRSTGKRIQNLVKRKRDEIEHFEIELIDKEKLLKDNIKEIAQLDEAILMIVEQQKLLHLEQTQFEMSNSINDNQNIENNLMSSWNALDVNSNPPENGENAKHNGNETQLIETSVSLNASTSSSPIKKCQKPQSHSALCAMRILQQNIAAQKAQIMKNLELNNCDKHQLDEEISKLQHLQRQYFLYEKDMSYTDEIPNRSEFCLSSDDGDISSEDILRIVHCDGNSNSSESREDKEKFLALSNDDNTMTHSTPYRSDSMLSRSQLDNNYESEYVISVPSYVVRGAGKQTHFEYEVRITLPDDKWTLLRRYSRFRELHLCMKSFYGEKVASIPFPRRELFSSNSESVARNRRRQLETYLRRLIVVCSKIPQCPFYEGVNGYGLSKNTLVEFSQFFKKGIFESGKYGTG